MGSRGTSSKPVALFFMITHSEMCNNKNLLHLKSKLSSNIYHYCGTCFEHETEYGKECCFNPDLIFCQYKMSNGKIQLRKYCKNCNTVDSINYKFNLVPKVSALPMAPRTNEERWKDVAEERQRFIDWANERRHAIFLQAHSDYLRSPKWRQLRQMVLQRDNHICQGCLIVKASEVHHLTYERWKNEMAFDLISLCSSCHSKIHN